MWHISGNNLQMAEGDYGLDLPITINGTTLSAADTIKITIKSAKNGSTIIERDMTPNENTVKLTLTEAESALLPVGCYAYSIDWYQDGNFMCNIIPCADLKVVDKA